MNFSDIVKNNRSYRRFDESRRIPPGDLRDLIDMARLTPSARNLQPLKYIIITEPDKRERVFPSLLWAGYLSDWQGPSEGERPSAYIIILSDTTISKKVKWDHGIAAQTILLGAVSRGYGGCMIGSADKNEIKEQLSIPDIYEIELIIALGHPVENVIIQEISSSEDIKYYRDPEGNHHVPKRRLDDIILDL